ncbi:hypothetical protein BpHYR1_016253 [Brachionus plicatilis]|uniref:Uncharacterized protein n=1 Tax=Brachionus plicatilis TaxID=10195 RepID=A0A3M7RIW4_BRAPC|nr:hypothetical protein BpHYR1_016253 [Brachionus plicatilis]
MISSSSSFSVSNHHDSEIATFGQFLSTAGTGFGRSGPWLYFQCDIMGADLFCFLEFVEVGINLDFWCLDP